MPNPSRAFGEITRFCAGIWIVVGVAIGLNLFPLDRWQGVLLLIAAGVSASLIVAGLVTRRIGHSSSLERQARQFLDTDLSRPGAAAERELLRRPERFGYLHGLAAALDELGGRIESQLKEVARKSRNLEALIDAMDEPLLATGTDQRILLCNRSAEAILGDAAQRRGLIGRHISDVLTQAQLLEMHSAAREGQTRRGRVRIATPLGHRTLQVSALPVPVAWGKGIFGAMMVLRDVTELDNAVQVKSDFVANASHELRTPVAAIRGAAETLAQAAEDDPPMARRLRDMILSHSGRLEELLRDLLDLSRLESPEVAINVGPIDLDQLRHNLRGLFEQALSERSLELDFELDDDLTGMRTDPGLLLLVMRNLVENATKFAHESTAIRIIGSVIEEELPAASAPGTALPRRGVVRLEVIDRGIGIPIAMQERVFERFFQVDSARTGTSAAGRRGTGLGLAIVKHAAKALGGRAGLTSVWGEGTTAFVEIPVEFAPAAT